MAKEVAAVFKGDKSLLHPAKYGIIANEISEPIAKYRARMANS
jgi:hypothetical protein